MRQLIHIFLGLAILGISLYIGIEETPFFLFWLFLSYAFFAYLSSLGVVSLVSFFSRDNEPFAVAPLYYLGSLVFVSSYPGISMTSFAAALLALSMGDGFSTLFGKSFKKRHIIYRNKSFEGAVWGAVAYLLSLIALGIDLRLSLVLPVIYAFVEMFSPIDDNLSVPLSIALATNVLFPLL